MKKKENKKKNSETRLAEKTDNNCPPSIITASVAKNEREKIRRVGHEIKPGF